MVKLVLLIALCVLPALAAATHPLKTPFTVEGKVYCDICRASSMALVYTKEGTTNSAGCYKIPIADDHLDQFCDADTSCYCFSFSLEGE
ncbi:unnamed protein product [Malus baccata var. baccata]